MTTPARRRRDLSWPVPAADLHDLDVIEFVRGEGGQVLWRVDDRPAATPQDCREVLMKRRQVEAPDGVAAAAATQLAARMPPPPTLDPEQPATDAPELPGPAYVDRVTAPVRRLPVSALHMPAWIAAARAALVRSRVEPAERLALVGSGMLMGVLFAVVGGPRVPATAHVAATTATATGVTTASAPLHAGASPAASMTGPRMMPAAQLVTASVPPLPIMLPAETFPRAGAMTVAPRAPRPRSSAAPAVLGAIQRYAVAYNRQDARATKAVWPSADRQALVKTFSGLREQRLQLLSCTTAVDGDRATASCLGTRRYRPRVGDSATRIQQGRWRFGLQRSAGTWLIASVNAP